MNKEISEEEQHEWRDLIQLEIDKESEKTREGGMTNPKTPHIKYLWDEERMQWYTDMKAYKKKKTLLRDESQKTVGMRILS